MTDPFRIDSPTCISFSGGRTSAYMLWRVLESNGGLPDEGIVCFANTGKEEEATLEFVQRCEREWGVKIHWVEYGRGEVQFETASRNGEPFQAIIEKRQYLPNPVTRFCTVELKIHAMHRYLKSLGWTEWDQFVGIRADEQRRVVKIRNHPHSEGKFETMCLPLADAAVTLRDIDGFWKAQSFGLQLPTVNGRTLAGNCDLCFLKAANQVQTLIAQKPERAIWWAKMEALALASKPSGAVFRSDRPSYAEMLKNARDQVDWVGHDEAIECYCGE